MRLLQPILLIRVISVPLFWSWRLSKVTSKQRANYEIIADGQGIHWPEIDKDISAERMLYGIPAPRPGKSSKYFLAKGPAGLCVYIL